MSVPPRRRKPIARRSPFGRAREPPNLGFFHLGIDLRPLQAQAKTKPEHSGRLCKPGRDSRADPLHRFRAIRDGDDRTGDLSSATRAQVPPAIHGTGSERQLMEQVTGTCRSACSSAIVEQAAMTHDHVNKRSRAPAILRSALHRRARRHVHRPGPRSACATIRGEPGTCRTDPFRSLAATGRLTIVRMTSRTPLVALAASLPPTGCARCLGHRLPCRS